MDKEELQQTEKEYEAIQRNFRIVAAIALGVLAFGAWFYHMVEKLNWLDAFYFCTITLTTVGYGDIVPTTDEGKIFTIGYVIVGIGIIATFANLLLKNAVVRRNLKQLQKSHKKNKTL